MDRRPVSTIATIGAGVVIAVVAFLPRATALDRGMTVDEPLWVARSARFTDAVLHGHFSRAYETGHPGVPTMWIGGLAQRTLPHGATLIDRLARARLGLAIADVALILAIWLMARPLLGRRAAGLGALTLALDPFLVAHNRVLQLDGILALSMLASFVALMNATSRTVRPRTWLVASGAFAGIALLERALFAGFLALAAIVVLQRSVVGLRDLKPRLLAAVVLFVAAWPVLWVNPVHPLSLILTGSASAAGDVTSSGFFLGRQVSPPGFVVYPVVGALRTTAFTLPAGIAAIVWARRRRRADGDARLAGAFLCFGALFALAIGFGFKTADRYLLPSLVAVDVAAAIGLTAWMRRTKRTALAIGAAFLALAAHAAPGLATHPLELSAYNWLAGGPPAARHAIVVGWGEGLEEAAKDLAKVPGAATVTVAATRINGFAQFFPGRTIAMSDSDLAKPSGIHADYALFYVSSLQIGRQDAIFARFRDRTPVYTLKLDTITYVTVYRV